MCVYKITFSAHFRLTFNNKNIITIDYYKYLFIALEEISNI